MEEKVNQQLKRSVKIAAIIVFVIAGGYLFIPAEGWTDSRLLAFGLLWFVAGVWVSQDSRIWTRKVKPVIQSDQSPS